MCPEITLLQCHVSGLVVMLLRKTVSLVYCLDINILWLALSL